MKMQSKELHRRSIVKSISYRLLSILADSVAAYFFTRNIATTIGIVIVANTYSTLLYYFHERFWAHIHWGRRNKIKSIFD
jgi:uncharacterized membrane protein